jgi:HAD superfamily hydrolase (TIGR01509 family)
MDADLNAVIPRLRAVVFDFDGLMVNSEDVFEVVGQELMRRRGLEMTDEIRRGMLGRRPTEAFEVLKRLTGIPDVIEELMAETETLFAATARSMLKLMPGLLELLDLVEQLGLPKAVATSSPRDYLQTLMNRFDLQPRFPIRLTAEDVTRGKPHPEIYERAAKRLNVDPSEMLVLEDSEPGTRAAAAAGAFVVAVPNIHTAWGDFSMSRLVLSSLHDPRLHEVIRTASP